MSEGKQQKLLVTRQAVKDFIHNSELDEHQVDKEELNGWWGWYADRQPPTAVGPYAEKVSRNQETSDEENT